MKGRVIRKNDGKKFYVNSSAYSEIRMSENLRDISVENLEDDLKGRRITRQVAE